MWDHIEDKEPLERLIAMLNILEMDDNMKTDWERTLQNDDHENVSEIGILADDYLITEDGNPNGSNIEFVRSFGEFDVFPVERDSFGWLLGGIQTSKGLIIFG